jgi:endonuclease/exonuclease/phosphatase family metal-dependent hydrolase
MWVFNCSAVKERQERNGFQLRQDKAESKRGRAGRGRRQAILLSAVALVALAIPAAADAKKKGKGGQKVTVMTRNLFLGADLGPALEAATIPEAVDGAGEIWNEFQATKFPERAVPLAREIKESGADLVGLQEVATWFRQDPSDGGWTESGGLGAPANQPVQDFLQLLTDQLKGKGPKYEVVHVQEEFSGELPVDQDQNDATGTGPLAGLGADFDARLLMRDVILARKGSKVKLGTATGANYSDENLFKPNVGGVQLTVKRGWESVEAKVKGKGKKKGKKAKTSKFRFVNTHLEAFGDPTIREAQAKELIAGPLNTSKQVILVGDLNSGLPDPHNVGNLPGQDPNDPLAFQAFQAAGFKDNGAVNLNESYPQTCCYGDLFDPNAVFDHTVDHVLTKPGLKTKTAFATGNDPAERTPSGLWPSDHGGKVSRLQLKK